MVATTAVVAALFVGVVLVEVTLDHARTPDVWKPDAPLMLTLTSVDAALPETIVVRLTVTNQSDSPLVWDSVFSPFLKRRVYTLDGDAVSWETVSYLKQPAPVNVDARFVTVLPGHSLSKDINLTYALQMFISGHAIPSHQPTGFEEMGRFEVPLFARGLHILVQYDLNMDD
jgi:hypothetical protein